MPQSTRSPGTNGQPAPIGGASQTKRPTRWDTARQTLPVRIAEYLDFSRRSVWRHHVVVKEIRDGVPAPLANFMARSQVLVSSAAFATPVTIAAWHDKPSYAIIATEDRALNPKLARSMYQRSGSHVTEIKGSHLVYVSQPRAVARVIEKAARSVGEAAAKAQ